MTHATYTLTLTPYLAAQLAACCLHAGLDIANLFPPRLTRHSEPPTAPEAAQPQPEPKTRPRINYPSLTGPGDILPDPGNIDWDDPATYL